MVSFIASTHAISATMRGEDGAWRVKTPVSNVAIVGGTHGNERNGVHMVRHYIKNPDIVR
jgi:succinylglutamate desuccinylase